MRRILLVGLLIAALPGRGSAQASLVPSPHPVYDWLADQRVAGRLPEYHHEERPMARVDVLGHLRTLERSATRLSRREQRLLNDFLNEFDQQRLQRQRAWTGPFLRGLPLSVGAAIRDRRDPVLIAGTSRDSVVSGAGYLMIGGGVASLHEGGTGRFGYLTTAGARAFLNTRFGLGWHGEADNIWTATERVLLERMPRYRGPALKPESNASYAYEAFLSFRTPKWFEVVTGRGTQVLGAAITEPLLLRAEAPFLPGIRVRLGSPRFHLTYLHAKLASPISSDTISAPEGMIAVRTAAERHLVAHRLVWQPHPRVTLAAHEALIYADRGLDLEYLNPAVPLLFAQGDKGDMDNLMIGGEMLLRPFNGTQLVASLVIDDRDARQPGSGTWTGPYKQAGTIGVEQRVLPGVRLGVGYTVTDPWVYTHWIRRNTWESRNEPLATALGPNGQEWAARMTTWLPWRTRLMAGARWIRRGLDPITAAGQVARCVGGSLTCGTVERETPRFAGADLHEIRRVEVELATEPIRGLPLTLTLRDDQVLRGSQLRSSRFLDARFRFGY